MKIAILGGGISGLSLAHFLLQNLRLSTLELHVFEKQSEPGGLCKSFSIGDYHFDYGPHNIHSVLDEFNELMISMHGDKYRDRDYNAEIAFFDNFIPYPMEGMDILKSIPLQKSISCASSFLMSRVYSIFRQWSDENFEKFIVNRFGRRLYNIYFGPFTLKTWGVTGDIMSADLAIQRIGIYNLWDIFKRTILGITPHTMNTEEDVFLNKRRSYHDDGSQPIVDGFLHPCLVDPRFHLHCDSCVSNIQHASKHITDIVTESGIYDVDYVFSTVSLSDLCKMLGFQSSLSFTSTRFLFLTLSKENVLTDKAAWVYFSDNRSLFNRIHEPRNMSELMAPEGKSSLCVEFTTTGHDMISDMTPDEILRSGIEGLEGFNLLNSEDIQEWRVVDCENTYPLQLLGYSEERKLALGHVNEFENIITFGRIGEFLYHNIDHCVMRASEIAEQFSKVANSVLGV